MKVGILNFNLRELHVLRGLVFNGLKSGFKDTESPEQYQGFQLLEDIDWHIQQMESDNDARGKEPYQ